MPKTIHGCVRIGRDKVYVTGQEKELAKAGLADAELIRLEEEGVVEGFASSASGGTADAENLPLVDDLSTILDRMDDIDEVKAMAKADKRITAKAIYNARISELS